MDLPVSGKSGGFPFQDPSWGAFRGGLAHTPVIPLDTQSQMLERMYTPIPAASTC